MKDVLWKSRVGYGLIGFFFVFSSAIAAESGKRLTFNEALATVGSDHPDLLMMQAEREIASADQGIAASRLDASVYLEGILRSGRPTSGNHDFVSDNSLRLTARKTLYDFGRTSAAESAAKSEVNARDAALIGTRDQRTLDIMARYFDVLIADMQFAADNEFMAVAYVTFDQAKDRLAVGQISAVDLADLESRFQETSLRRNASEQRQRITRALLANALNRPGNLPGDIEDPALPGNQRVLPEYETLISSMLQNNIQLKANIESLAASQKRLEFLRAEKRPILDAEVQAADYSRSASTRDSLSAGVILTLPLFQGNRVDARIAREQAQFQKLQAGNQKLKMDLTQALLENYLEIGQLQRSGRSAAKKQAEYRDLVLEKSRGQYEVELKTNLGTSMAETVEATLRTRKNEYQLALAFARLEALLGAPLITQDKIKQ